MNNACASFPAATLSPPPSFLKRRDAPTQQRSSTIRSVASRRSILHSAPVYMRSRSRTGGKHVRAVIRWKLSKREFSLFFVPWFGITYTYVSLNGPKNLTKMVSEKLDRLSDHCMNDIKLCTYVKLSVFLDFVLHFCRRGFWLFCFIIIKLSYFSIQICYLLNPFSYSRIVII